MRKGDSKITTQVKKKLLKQIEDGIPIDEICRRFPMSKATFYKQVSLSEISAHKIMGEYKRLPKELKELVFTNVFES